MTRIATFLRPVPVTATAIAAATGAWLAWTPVAGADTTEPGTIADLVERTSPAVVTILSTQEAPDEMAGMPEGSPFGSGSPFEEFLRRFGMPEAMPSPQPQPQPGPRGIGVGSGFVIEDDGYIVTNNHVVDNAETVKVRLADEREFDAEVIGTDPQTDLALIKIDTTGLPELTLGDSDALRVGEDVIAVGNPFGLGGTVTRGIVSAMARDINAGPYVDFIQTDAAINRGNSGGPLLNLEGEVIGVNSAIYSPNGGSVGVGFAIPSNTVKTVIAQLRSSGSVERGWLGVTIQNVTPEIAAAIGMDDPHGALVADVVDDGPSAGKLETGDVIVSFDGKRVESSRDLPKLVSAVDPDT
ncbi:MAG TPA: trypsin-like peptidase domain-containing protein, partial [Amaricoccus sp.]|nr:trypsin-like peptidase domain-containing protein [Amaricoccus sp.]